MVLVPMPFVIGAPRSGTTLLRFMLDAHPELAIPPETGFLALGDHLDAALTSGEERRRAFFALVTSFPPDAPGWRDFGIAEDRFWAACDRSLLGPRGPAGVLSYLCRTVRQEPLGRQDAYLLPASRGDSTPPARGAFRPRHPRWARRGVVAPPDVVLARR
jgi:Sulfotransferase family